MNLILTSTCNKNCSFCFASGKEDKNQYDINKLKKLINNNPNDVLKLLGGEPTLYKDFVELLGFCEEIPNVVVLVSNFLIYKEEVKTAIKRFQKVKNLNFLLNAAETTEKQFEVMTNNIKELIDKKSISLGFTLDESRDFESYKIWLDRFLGDKEIKEKIENIRMSVPFPANGNKDNFYLYKNYHFADTIEGFVKYAFPKNLKVSIDCGLFPCMFRNQEQEDFITKWADKATFGCGSLALDIFSDESASLCYPRKDINIKDINRHGLNINNIADNLLNKKALVLLNDEVLPKECISCEHFRKKCAGPCLGFCK